MWRKGIAFGTFTFDPTSLKMKKLDFTFPEYRRFISDPACLSVLPDTYRLHSAPVRVGGGGEGWYHIT